MTEPWTRMVCAVALAGALAACETDGASAVDATTDTLASDDTDATSPDAVDTDEPGTIAVGDDACCLSLGEGAAVWAEAGDIWLYDPATRVTTALVSHPAAQKDPVLSGGVLVWADARGGDFDLWTMDLATREASLLVGGAGDQDQPSMSGSRVVWVGRDAPPHGAQQAEIWVMDLDVAASARPLTQDGFEQTQPHIAGDRVVWSDFSASLEGQYLDLVDPALNNADILGYDLDEDEAFTVTRHPSKQLRPAIDGDSVVWLDWRGINPEPKYSEFQVFAKRLDELEGRRIAWSSWTKPELWQRPAISDGTVLWIAEPADDDARFTTAVFGAELDGDGTPWLVGGSSGILDAVTLRNKTVAWLGAGKLRVRALAP